MLNLLKNLDREKIDMHRLCHNNANHKLISQNIKEKAQNRQKEPLPLSLKKKKFL